MKPILVRMLTFLFCTALFLNNAGAVEPKLNSEISPENPLRIALPNITIPYHYLDKELPSGYVVDIWTLWAEKTNTPIEFVMMEDELTESYVLDEKAHVHGSLANRLNRDQHFDFSGEVYVTPINVYVHKDLEIIQTMSELSPYIIGVVASNNFDHMLLDKNSSLSSRYYNTWDELIDGIFKGEIKVFASFDFFSFRSEGYKQLSDLFPAYKSIKIGEIKTHVAVKKGNKKIEELVEAGFKLITNDERQTINDKWFSTRGDENELLISISAAAEPFMGVDSEGQAVGLLIDVWKLWAKKTKTKIRFVPNTAELSLRAISENKTNIHAGYPESMTTNSGLPRAKHIYSTYSSLFVYDSYDFNLSIEQLNGKSIGLYKGAPYQEQLKLTYPNFNLVFYDNLDQAINDAITGKIAGFVTSAQMTKQRLDENNIAERFHQVDDISYESKIYSLVSNKDKSLLKQINNGFELISQQELVDIENRWIKNPDARFYSTQKNKFRLTAEEKLWLAENPEMNVAIVEDWKPYEFVNERGEISGISRDMFEIATKLTGQKYNFVVFPTWEELYLSFKEGQLDIVANITASEQRSSFANFTSPYWRTSWSVISHKSIDNVNSIKNFYGKRVAIIQGYQIIKEIHDKHPQVLIHVVKDFNEAHELLKAGVIDGILDLMTVSAQYIQDNSLYQYKIHVLDDMGSDNAHIGTRKALTVQARILEKVVLSMSEADIERILKKWNKVDVVAGIKFEIYWRNITIAVSLATIIIFVILMWNRKLKSEILLRQHAEEKLKHIASHDVMTGLPNRALLTDRLKQAISYHGRSNKELSILFLDLDGFKQVNDSYGHDVGDELLTQVSQRLAHIGRNSDTVARFGGDEFIYLATSLDSGIKADRIAEKIIADLTEPFVLSVATVSIGVSIGISCFPKDGQDVNSLIKAADGAMYVVKANGKNSYAFAR